MKKGFVYIIQDTYTHHLYIGSTDDVNRRLQQHKYGHTYTTRRMHEIILIFVQEFKTITQARRIEMWLKKLKRRDYIEKIISDGSIRKKF